MTETLVVVQKSTTVIEVLDPSRIVESVSAGPKGEQGEPGPTGAAGPKGDQGDTGPAGATGPQGEKGDTGDQGPAGADGQDGADGADGAGENNPQTATTLEMTTGTETDLRSMSPALVKAAAEEHGGVAGSVDPFTRFVVELRTTDNSSPTTVDLSSFPALGFSELYLIHAEVFFNVAGAIQNGYYEHKWFVERILSLVSSVNPSTPTNHSFGKNTGAQVVNFSHDTLSSKPKIEVQGISTHVTDWTVIVSYRKVYDGS